MVKLNLKLYATLLVACWGLAGVAALPEGEMVRRLNAEMPTIVQRAIENYRVLDAAATPLMRDAGGRRFAPHGYNRATKKLDMRPISWWTCGYFPGALQILGQWTDDAALKARAVAWTDHLLPLTEAKSTPSHDLGLMIACSFGSARRLANGDSRYDKAICATAALVAKRFSPKLGLVRSWGRADDALHFQVIPDNLPVLEIFELASKISGDQRYDVLARSHADVTLRNHFRPDNSVYHVLDYDQQTGRVQGIARGQGASCFTAWSRGQSWAIYGYTMMYRETRERRYLDAARRAADFAIGHPNMPADGVPFWDYGAPGEERDSSAAAIMASALIELSSMLKDDARVKYRDFAVKQLLTLASPDYFAPSDELSGFLLRHGVEHKPGGLEIDTPLDYGDYYFLEALHRFSLQVKRTLRTSADGQGDK